MSVDKLYPEYKSKNTIRNEETFRLNKPLWDEIGRKIYLDKQGKLREIPTDKFNWLIFPEEKESMKEKVERLKQQEYDKLSDKEKQKITDEEERIWSAFDKFFGEEDASSKCK
jgi:hypothetical protein